MSAQPGRAGNKEPKMIRAPEARHLMPEMNRYILDNTPMSAARTSSTKTKSRGSRSTGKQQQAGGFVSGREAGPAKGRLKSLQSSERDLLGRFFDEAKPRDPFSFPNAPGRREMIQREAGDQVPEALTPGL